MFMKRYAPRGNNVDFGHKGPGHNGITLDWIIQSLLLADRDWIVLPRLSIDRNQFGRAEITVDFMNFFAI